MQLINSCNNLLHCFLFHKNMDDGTGIYCKFRDNEFLHYIEKSMWLLARLSDPQPGRAITALPAIHTGGKRQPRGGIFEGSITDPDEVNFLLASCHKYSAKYIKTYTSNSYPPLVSIRSTLDL